MSLYELSVKSALIKDFNLPEDAVEYLCDVWSVIQFFDDAYDYDEVDLKDFDRVLWAVFVKIPQNPFYVRNSYQLSNCCSLQILKWHAANSVEKTGNHDYKSFVWRAGYYDLVLLVALMCLGPDKLAGIEHNILGLYGEDYEDYKAEFD